MNFGARQKILLRFLNNNCFFKDSIFLVLDKVTLFMGYRRLKVLHNKFSLASLVKQKIEQFFH